MFSLNLLVLIWKILVIWGKKALSNYIGKDITNILFRVFPHNKEKTLNVLKEYIVGTVKDLV